MHDSMFLEGHLVGGAWWKIHLVLQVLDFCDFSNFSNYFIHAAMLYYICINNG